MKPTLVTGATGFIGWHVLQQGHRVRALVQQAHRAPDLVVIIPAARLKHVDEKIGRQRPVSR